MSFIAVSIGGGAALGFWGASKSSGAAKEASEDQAAATKYAADLQYKAGQEALDFQKEAYFNSQYNMQPWLNVGSSAVNTLGGLMGLNVPQQGTGQVGGYVSPYQQQKQQTAETQKQRQSLNSQLSELQGILATYDSNPNLFSPEQAAQIESSRQNIEQRVASLQNQLAGLSNPSSGTVYAGGSPNYDETMGGGQFIPEGQGSFGELAAPMNDVMQDWQQDPGYQFRLDQGEDAVNRYLADKGMPFGGTAAKALLEYNQNFATNEYQNVYARTAADRTDRFNRLATLAGIGQTASQSSNAAGINFANNAGNIAMNTAQITGDLATQAANARASGMMASANAWNSALNNLGQLPMQAYGLYQLGLFNKNQNG